jgi:aspartate ammonia-lyase
MRIEKDYLGSKEIPKEALYGIHALRARDNFPDNTAFHEEWYASMGITKLACYQTYQKFKQAVDFKYPGRKVPLRFIPDDILEEMIKTAHELARGDYKENFIVPALQGGAGTSINMNINEIISNVTLRKIGRQPGDYQYIDPIEHANIFQSTNDVVPTALKIAAMRLLESLEEEINALRSSLEKLENKHRNHLRIGYTQMKEAVPSSYGKLFSAYNEALSRDWWRVSKCFERIKVVNLGGSAIGTGITVPTYFIMEVVPVLRKLTGLPLSRSENMPDTTSNLDSFVEVHATLKAHAVNLEKMVSDLRLLGSDFMQQNEVSLPQQQVGSSIMPGKVNPVIPEYVISAVRKIYASDSLISSLSGLGNLELNPYLPLIGHTLLESLKLLKGINQTLRKNMIDSLMVNTKNALSRLYKSPAVTTALSPYIGYHKASDLARYMKEKNVDILSANKHYNYLKEEELKNLLKPDSLVKMGFRISELLESY